MQHVSVQRRQHGPRPSSKGSLHRSRCSPRRTYDETYQSPWQRQWGISINKEKTYNPPKRKRDLVTSSEFDEDINPTTDIATNTAFASIVELDDDQATGKSYSDLTGRFPAKSQQGNLYVLVFYTYDDNAILVEPLKSRSDTDQLKAYQAILQRVKTGSALTVHWMDNKASTAIKKLLTNDYNLSYQLVPPHIHRRNAAERAIRTFKNHFIAGLCSADNDFPIRLWDQLLPQAEITVNLLRASRCNPAISAYEAVFGPFDYNKTPLAPPGCKVLIHEKPGQRKSWDPHGVKGWYLGPAMEHYRCHRCYVTSTQAERISDTVEFFPAEAKTPIMSIADAAIAAAEALTEALHSNISSSSMDQLLDPSQATLKRLSTIFELPSNNDDKGSPRVETPSPRVPPPPRVETIEEPISSRTRSAAAAISEQEGNEFMQRCWASSVAHPVTGAPMEYRQLITDPLTKDAWQLSAANEFGRLAQGVGGRIKGTNTITFIHHSELPLGRQPTYPRFVCTERPHKTEPNRTRLTLGGNLVDYPGDVSVGTAEMDTIKMLLNSVVSTPGAEFCTADVTNFYLNTPMERSEYFRTHISLIPDEIIKEYNLHELVDTKGYVLERVDKGMYSLPQAGMLANKLLKERLGPHGYQACTHTPGLWRHRERPIMFTLIVDDFGIQHVGKQHAQHLIAALKQDYEAVTTDWEGKLYCGITLDWDYKARTVNLSMPGYVERALQEFQHVQPAKPEHQPHRNNEPQYGVKLQLTDSIDTSAPLDKEGQTTNGKILILCPGCRSDHAGHTQCIIIPTNQRNGTNSQ